MTRAYYDSKPKAFEAVGNGDFLYRWDVKEEKAQQEMMLDEEGKSVSEERVQYSCNEVTINGEPGYAACIVSVIRSRYTADDELALINKYNSYKQGIITDATIEQEYADYLTFVKEVKEQVKKALGINDASK